MLCSRWKGILIISLFCYVCTSYFCDDLMLSRAEHLTVCSGVSVSEGGCWFPQRDLSLLQYHRFVHGFEGCDICWQLLKGHVVS